MKTSFEYELNLTDGLDELYSETLRCDVSYFAYFDSDYGADADGNRGVRMVFLDYVGFKILKEGKDVTEWIKAEYPRDYEKMKKQADAAAESAAQEELL